MISLTGGGTMKKIVIKWNVKKVKDSSRIGMMYCFKSCDVNQN